MPVATAQWGGWFFSTVNIGEPVGGDTFFFSPRVSKIENDFHLQKSDDFRENCHICMYVCNVMSCHVMSCHVM